VSNLIVSDGPRRLDHLAASWGTVNGDERVAEPLDGYERGRSPSDPQDGRCPSYFTIFYSVLLQEHDIFIGIATRAVLMWFFIRVGLSF
jgi:hypothetical protein